MGARRKPHGATKARAKAPSRASKTKHKHAAVDAHALDDEALHVFLRRTRRQKGVVELPPIGAFLAETLSVTARLVPSMAGSLFLDHPAGDGRRHTRGDGLTFVAVFGAAAKDLVGRTVPRGEGIVGHVYTRGKTYASNDVSKDPLFFGKLDRQSSFQTKSVVAAPLRLEQKVCGVFELINRSNAAGFSERDVELVELIGEYISRAILNAVDILKQNELAFRDDLTGLRNPRGLDAAVRDVVEQSLSGGSDMSVMFVDMDKLKPLNDKFGHRVGSEAIRRVGTSLAEIIGATGTVFRFGGDEFVAVLPGLSLAAAERLGKRVYREMPTCTKGRIRGGGTMPPLSVSVGVASLEGSLRKGGKRDLESLASRVLTAADNALYRSKREGRGRVSAAARTDDSFGK